jgi:hypothetical protein
LGKGLPITRRSKSSKPIRKRFIVRKYVYALSAAQALKMESLIKADDCYVDEQWSQQHMRDLNPAIGFNLEVDDD